MRSMKAPATPALIPLRKSLHLGLQRMDAQDFLCFGMGDVLAFVLLVVVQRFHGLHDGQHDAYRKEGRGLRRRRRQR